MDLNSFPVQLITILPIITVIVLRFTSTFVEPQNEIRSRIDLIEKSLTEKLAVKLTGILNHLRSVFETDDLLRENGTETPDLVGDYSNELTRVFKIVNRLRVLNSRYRIGHTFLTLTVSIDAVKHLSAIDPFGCLRLRHCGDSAPRQCW